MIANAVVSGIGIGSIYALIALGYALILGASGVFNFAQGSAVMGGALVSYGVGSVEHLPVLVVLGVVLATGALTGFVTHAIAVRPLTHRPGVSNFTFGTFLSTLGIGLVFDSIMSLTFGPNTYPVKPYVSQEPIRIAGINVSPIYLTMFLVVIALAVAFELILSRTRWGLVMRAVFNDVEGASLTGISISRVVLAVFVLGCALAAVAGFLVAPLTFAQTGISSQYAFYGFAAMAVGGFGSLRGAVIGGLLVGLASVVPTVWISPNYSDLLIYALLLAVLLTRPQGLFGEGGRSFGAAGIREV
jgi:branched-chain amino acid transport system permease protein